MNYALPAALAAALLLSACGSKSSHVTCVDGDSTATYMKKFSDDLAAAFDAGKVTKEQFEKSGTDMMYLKADENDPFGSLCKFADGERQKFGI